MKKKILCLLTVLVMAFAVMMFAACNGGKDSESEDPNSSSSLVTQEITVTIDESLSVNLFESAKLTARTNSKQAVTYTSSDTSVLTVDSASGAIVPQKAGTATVTASVEGKNAACAVTVVAPDSDDITFVVINKEVKLKRKKTAKLEAQAFWGDKELGGFSVEFKSDVPGVVTVDAEGVLTGVKVGTATITVSGTLKGVNLGSDTVSVNVSEDVTVSADVRDLTLYTAEGEDPANPLITSRPLAVTVTIDGKEEPRPAFGVQSSDEAVVKYENGELVAKGKKGTATVTVSYTSAQGTSAQDTINVTVLHPIKKIAVPEAVIAGANRGEIVYSPEFTAVAADKAYIESEEYPVTIDGEGNIVVEIGDVPASDTAITIKAVVDSADTTYEISLTAIVYDFLIGGAAEFKAFANALNTTDYIYARLTGNVDMENKAIATVNNTASGIGSAVSFSLDGAGFSVLNLYADSKYGAFAANVGKNAAGKNSVIKNIAFANYSNTGNSTAGLFYEIANVSFENFYLSSSVNFFNGGMVAVRDTGNVTYKNCVVYCLKAEDPNRTETANFCKIGGLTSEGVPNTQKNYTDTYAVNPVASKMILGSVHTVRKHQPWETEADAKDYEVDDGVTTFTEGLYKSWAEFAAAHPALPESFDSGIWKINADGELVFKTMPEPEKPAFDYRAAITGKYGEKLFKPASDDNSVTWVQNDYGNVYKFTNTVTAQNDTRGFYLDFDYMQGLKELGATQISFTLISGSEDAPNGTKYFSFATGRRRLVGCLHARFGKYSLGLVSGRYD